MWLEWPSGGAGAFCLNARTLAEVSVPRFAASCLRYSYKEKQKHSRYVVLVKSTCSHSREWLATYLARRGSNILLRIFNIPHL